MARPTPTVYFMGTGTLLLFSLGVAKYLKEHYTWDTTTVLTVSGGGIPAVALLTLAPEHFDSLAHQVASLFSSLPGGVMRPFYTGEYYQRALRYVVKPEVLSFLRKRLLIKTTIVPCIKSKIYDGPYTTVEEVVGDLCASAYIPVLFFMRPPFPGHMMEVDGALGISKWKREDWPDTLVVGPSFTGKEDVWYRKDNVWDKIRPLSYYEQMALYNLGYQQAVASKEAIERKIGPHKR